MFRAAASAAARGLEASNAVPASILTSSLLWKKTLSVAARQSAAPMNRSLGRHGRSPTSTLFASSPSPCPSAARSVPVPRALVRRRTSEGGSEGGEVNGFPAPLLAAVLPPSPPPFTPRPPSSSLPPSSTGRLPREQNSLLSPFLLVLFLYNK